jgi:MFS family permease
MKTYWLFCLVTVLALSSVNLYAYTQSWYALQLTGEKLGVGLTWTLFFVPGVVLMPALQRSLNRWDGRQLLMASQAAQALVFGIFACTLSLHPSIWQIYLLALMFGVTFAPFYPVTYIILKNALPEQKAVRYSNFFEIMVQVAGVLAAFLANALLAKLGFITILGIAAAFSVLAVVVLSFMQWNATSTTSPKETSEPVQKGTGNILRFLIPKTGYAPNTDSRVLAFGFIHQLPQNLILVSNVPLVLYVYEIMKKGPLEYAALDAIYGVVAMAASLLWAKFSRASAEPKQLAIHAVLSGVGLWVLAIAHADGIMPYAIYTVLSFFMVSSKIQSRAIVVKNMSEDALTQFTPVYQFWGNTLLMVMFALITQLSSVTDIRTTYLVLGSFSVIFAVATTVAFNGKNAAVSMPKSAAIANE